MIQMLKYSIRFIIQALRERGNTLLKAKDYDGAIRCYSEVQQQTVVYLQAMEVDSYNSKLYSNRCTAYLLLENYDKALADATKCVSIDPDWYKGHVQMGSCYMGMKDYQSAIKEYKKGSQIERVFICSVIVVRHKGYNSEID